MGKPTVRGILELLAAAGETGMQAGEVARSFTEPPRQQRRSAQCNTELNRLAFDGRVRRSQDTEPSSHWQHVPVYRWYITAAGRKYLAGHDETARRRGAAQAVKRVQAQELTRLRDSAAVLAAEIAASGCTQRRTAAVRALAEMGLNCAEIGAAFEISRERTRQIVSGINLPKRPCRCAGHRAQREQQAARVLAADRDEQIRDAFAED